MTNTKYDELINILRLTRTKNIGLKTFYDLIEKYENAEDAIEYLKNKKIFQIAPKSQIESEIEQTQDCNASIITYKDSKYPFLLRNIPDPPPIITIKGNIDILQKNCISIVGARNSSLNGENYAYKIAKEFAEIDFNVCSGLARGIDTYVHKGALPKNTTAVIACGINNIYPPENEKLFHEIAEKGLIITEMPFNTPPYAKNFPRRNRIISGLAKATIIVEARLQSGTLVTARTALEQNREIFAVPGLPYDPRSAGSNKLIKNGANLFESIEDVMHLFDNKEIIRNTPAIKPINCDNFKIDYSISNKNMILKKLNMHPITIDDLIHELKLDPNTVRTIITELELADKIQIYPDGKIALLLQEENLPI